jgi:uncharacterized protein (DUF1778 family)
MVISAALTCTAVYRTMAPGLNTMPIRASVARESKRERLEARLTLEQKRRIEQAARIHGTSVSDFVILSAEDAALRIIRDREVLTLNQEARKVFARALLNAPVPSRNLAVAAKRYSELTKG